MPCACLRACHSPVCKLLLILIYVTFDKVSFFTCARTPGFKSKRRTPIGSPLADKVTSGPGNRTPVYTLHHDTRSDRVYVCTCIKYVQISLFPSQYGIWRLLGMLKPQYMDCHIGWFQWCSLVCESFSIFLKGRQRSILSFNYLSMKSIPFFNNLNDKKFCY